MVSREVVKAVRDPFMDLTYMVFMLKYDSVHKQFQGTIAVKEEDCKAFLIVNGVEVMTFHAKGPRWRFSAVTR